MEDEPVTAGPARLGTGNFYDIVWSWIESQGQESEVCGWKNQGKGSGLREWSNMEKTTCNGWNLRAETCRDAGMLWKATASEKKYCQGNHPSYERPTKMLGLFQTWSRAVRGRSWQRFQLLEPILRRFSCHRDVAFTQISAKDVSRRPPLNILMQQERPGNLVHFFHATATGNIEVFCWNLIAAWGIVVRILCEPRFYTMTWKACTAALKSLKSFTRTEAVVCPERSIPNDGHEIYKTFTNIYKCTINAINVLNMYSRYMLNVLYNLIILL